MLDAKGDPEITRAQNDMRATLEKWIPIILAAQEPDGYMQTAFTLPRVSNAGGNQTPGPFNRWERRADHELHGRLFPQAAIAHYMTDQSRATLQRRQKLADCWDANAGRTQAWYDGHGRWSRRWCASVAL